MKNFKFLQDTRSPEQHKDYFGCLEEVSSKNEFKADVLISDVMLRST